MKTPIILDKGDVVYSVKDGKRHVVSGFTTERVGERDICKVACGGNDFFHDELTAFRKKNDTWWGRLFFGTSK